VRSGSCTHYHSRVEGILDRLSESAPTRIWCENRTPSWVKVASGGRETCAGRCSLQMLQGHRLKASQTIRDSQIFGSQIRRTLLTILRRQKWCHDWCPASSLHRQSEGSDIQAVYAAFSRHKRSTESEAAGFQSRTVRKMTRKRLCRQRLMLQSDQHDQQATVGAGVLWPADEVEPYTLVLSHTIRPLKPAPRPACACMSV